MRKHLYTIATIAALVMLLVTPWGFAGPPPMTGGGTGSGLSAASSSDTITGTSTTSGVTPKALADALAAYTHAIISNSSAKFLSLSIGTNDNATILADGNATFKGNLVAKSLGVTRGAAGQYAQFYEAAGGDNSSISWGVPNAVTDTQRLNMPIIANTAGQAMVFGAPSVGVSQATWATPHTFAETGALATGLLKNTITTGALSAATGADLPAATTIVASGSISVTAPNTYVICTSTCDVTPLPPAAGVQLCVRNAPASATAITLHALGGSSTYELTDHSAWATANHKLVSAAGATAAICVVGYDAVHYATMNNTLAWTDTAP